MRVNSLFYKALICLCTGAVCLGCESSEEISDRDFSPVISDAGLASLRALRGTMAIDGTWRSESGQTDDTLQFRIGTYEAKLKPIVDSTGFSPKEVLVLYLEELARIDGIQYSEDQVEHSVQDNWTTARVHYQYEKAVGFGLLRAREVSDTGELELELEFREEIPKD